MNKNEKNHQSEASIDRRIVACEMTKLFNLAATSKKNNPGRWTKDRREKYNETSHMIQYLFDERLYVQAKNWLDSLDSDHQLTGRRREPVAKAESKNE